MHFRKQPIDWSQPIQLDYELAGELNAIGYWPSVTLGGTTLFDYGHKQRIHGELTGYASTDNPWSMVSAPGGRGSLFLDGVNDFANYGVSSVYDPGDDDFTVSIWSRTTSTAIMVSFGNYNGAQDWYLGNVSGYVFNWNNAAVVSTGVNISDGQWHLQTGVKSGSTVYAYLDGRLLGSSGGAATCTPGALAIGRLGSLSSFYWSGGLDDAIICRRALSTADVSAYYEASLTGRPLLWQRSTRTIFPGLGGGGGIVVTATASICRAQAVAPSVVLGSVSVTPTRANVRNLANAPTTRLGSMSITPTMAVARAAAIAPTVQQGSLSITPTLANTRSLAIAPTIVQGSLSITPTHAEGSLIAISPTVQLGALEITPAIAAAVAMAIAPSIPGADVTVTPTLIDSSAVAIAPTTQLGSLLITPELVIAQLQAVAPTIVQGSLAITPTHAEGSAVAIDPTVQLGSVSITLGAATFAGIAIAPTVVMGSVSITPAIAGLVAVAIAPEVATGSVTVTPTAAAARAIASAVTVIIVSPIGDAGGGTVATLLGGTVAFVMIGTWLAVPIKGSNGATDTLRTE